MMHLLSLLDLSTGQWVVSGLCVMLLGFSKTGIGGVSTLVIPVMAAIFGGKSSAAIILPLLISGDLIAVRHYRTNANWPYIFKVLPWSFGGLALGVLVGNLVSDLQFKMIIGVSVLFCLGIMIWMERHGDTATMPDKWWFGAIMGLAGGFTTMIGNAAGQVMTVYLLAMRLPKYDFIGTGAWFFMIMNLTKLPLQIIFWKAITPATLAFDAVMFPAILIGTFIGIRVVRKIPEKPFRVTVTILTAAAAVKLFF